MEPWLYFKEFQTRAAEIGHHAKTISFQMWFHVKIKH